MWVKRERVTLQQRSNGVDWGSKRDVILVKGRVHVFKTRGHKGWSAIGSTSYYSPQWVLDPGVGLDDRRTISLNHGYGRKGEGLMTAELWTSVLPTIAKEMGLAVSQMPAKVPRGGTLVWQDE